MAQTTWFQGLPVIGKLPPARAAAKLRELGDAKTAGSLQRVAAKKPGGAATRGAGASPRSSTKPPESVRWWPFHDKPWQHTSHAFGFIAAGLTRKKQLEIRHAGDIPADPTLKGARIKITLDRFRVAEYPGRGIHRILLDFYAQNQTSGGAEDLHFNLTCRVHEGDDAAILGYPIFVGLNVGGEGVALRCFTVNVKNDDDEALLSALESDVFKSGLKLVSTLQPAIATLSGMAVALTKSMATRHRNVAVQDFYVGLDFTDIPLRARLSEGSYVAVQLPKHALSIWDWSEWVYNPSKGQIVRKNDSKVLIPYNYLILSVSRYGE